MNDLERLVKRGWRLQVDWHWDGKFHAQIYKHKLGDDGHHHLGQMISEALFNLNEYVAGRESPTHETSPVPMKPSEEAVFDTVRRGHVVGAEQAGCLQGALEGILNLDIGRHSLTIAQDIARCALANYSTATK